MKLNFHVSPNLRNKNTTQIIMRDLCICLCIVYVISCIYYASVGTQYLIRSLVLLASSLVTTFVCEFAFAKIRKRDVKHEITNSFGWITALILTMMVPITCRPYALIVATAFAILFGKMLFGGFGHNVFNPAAVGRAVIFASFVGAAGTVTDLAPITDTVTGATPTTFLANTYGWLPTTENALNGFLNQVGGWSSLVLGTYPGAIGETFTLAIVIVGIILIVRKVIDWRIPVVYLGSIFILTMIVAIFKGVGSYHGIPGFLWYPTLHLLVGGVVFGAFFMLTDPVTSPTSAAGRVIFALGAAILTVLIRLAGNLPEGCLYSILIMNMFTPMIEDALDGKQLEVVSKARKITAVLALVGILLTIYAMNTLTPVTEESGKTEAKVVEEVEVDVL